MGDWQLAILRFALTLDRADRAVVLAIARQMDRAGDNPAFGFFSRASTEVCNAIAGQSDDPERDIALRRHLARIESEHFRRTLEAAFRMGPITPKPRSRKNRGLWEGLDSDKGLFRGC